jgi:hypothetical protein
MYLSKRASGSKSSSPTISAISGARSIGMAARLPLSF